jgi:hypothetical protein
MSNVKAQMPNQAQSPNFKIFEFEIWHSFDIWILSFEI